MNNRCWCCGTTLTKQGACPTPKKDCGRTDVWKQYDLLGREKMKTLNRLNQLPTEQK